MCGGAGRPPGRGAGAGGGGWSPAPPPRLPCGPGWLGQDGARLHSGAFTPSLNSPDNFPGGGNLDPSPHHPSQWTFSGSTPPVFEVRGLPRRVTGVEKREELKEKDVRSSLFTGTLLPTPNSTPLTPRLLVPIGGPV